MVSVFWDTARDFFPSKPTYLPEHYPDLTGKTALVTGSNTGIGYESAKALLKKNATVIFVNRNIDKTEKAIAKIKEELADSEGLDKRIISIKADLGNLPTIKTAVEELINKYGIKEIHYSILNAGVMQPPVGSKTAQGYEMHIGTNVLGHQLLQELIHPLILNATKNGSFEPRVVWVTSSSHLASPANGGIDWDSFKDASKCNTQRSYGQSKTGNIYQAWAYAQKYKKDGIISVSAHPGYLRSELQRGYGTIPRAILRTFLFEAVYGSYTELFGALSPEVTLEKTGSYIGPWGRFREVRDDIHAGLTDGTSQKFWDWAHGEIKQYL